MTLLETKSLSIGYQEKRIHKVLQRDINIRLCKGEIISLMGQNGVGKTTFIKTISGLQPALTGDIFYGGENLKNLSNRQLATRLSLVLTEKPFNSSISVLELIAIGRHPYSGWMGVLSKKDKDVIEWAINETHINYLVEKKLYQLSDGQLQKVMIARALAQETDLIILDEPAAHLDLHNKIEVMMLLRQIAAQGKGILISTHDMQISTQLSDRLWLFNFNETVKEGVPEDLILNGTLEKTLFLQDYGYDMIHGSVSISQKGPQLAVDGPEDIKFWTRQALKRNGFRVVASADIRIRYQDTCWQIITADSCIKCNSIQELLDSLHSELK